VNFGEPQNRGFAGEIAGAQGLAQRGIHPRGGQTGGEIGKGQGGHQGSLFGEDDEGKMMAKI